MLTIKKQLFKKPSQNLLRINNKHEILGIEHCFMGFSSFIFQRFLHHKLTPKIHIKLTIIMNIERRRVERRTERSATSQREELTNKPCDYSEYKYISLRMCQYNCFYSINSCVLLTFVVECRLKVVNLIHLALSVQFWCLVSVIEFTLAHLRPNKCAR